MVRAESSGCPIAVSVVIPVYNRAGTVARAVRSALLQTAPPKEVLVVDDASTDDSAAVAEAAGARVIRLAENGGVSGARNRGFGEAACEWVALLDSDDEWEPEHLERLWAARDGHLIVGDGLRGSQSGRLMGNMTGRPLVMRSPEDVMFPTSPVTSSTVLIRRDALLEAGGFGPYPVAEDLDMWCRLLERGTGVALPAVGGVYHEHSGQISTDKGPMRTAVFELMDRFAGRPWLTRRLRGRVEGVMFWDEFRESLRAGRRRAALRCAVALARPRRAAALVPLWRFRTLTRAGTGAAAEITAWRSDRARYGHLPWVRERSVWAVALYRVGRWNQARSSARSRRPVERVLRAVAGPVGRVAGATLDPTVVCGPGLRIDGRGGASVRGGAVIGANCTIGRGAVVGPLAGGTPAPVLDDDVVIGPHAQVLGDVRVGRGATVGAWVVVTADVPAGDRLPGRRSAAPRGDVAGVPIDWIDMDDAVELIVSASGQRAFLQVATVNLDFLVSARRDDEVRSILNDSGISLADGAPVVWLGRVQGARQACRVAGSDLMPRLMAPAAAAGIRVFLLGGEDGAAATAAERLVEAHPDLQVSVYEPPVAPLEDFDDDAILARLDDARPDLLLVAFSHPKAEKWIYRHRDRLPMVAINVGCSFDLIAGRRGRAPGWMQAGGLEWLSRVAHEPRRLAGRYLSDGLWLLGVFLPSALRRRVGGRRSAPSA